MAIRIREVNGHVVALCAAKTTALPGDLYLDDNVHYALSSRFGADWKEVGLIDADPILLEIMHAQERGNGREWYGQTPWW